ncbi:MAG: ABC transporter permease [Clostridia bacterium]|nr:ABC transporter permease [Clostridia bacterium]
MSNHANHAVHEPFVRVVKRDRIRFSGKVVIRLVAILLALLVDALFILCVTGLNPISVYTTMFDGTFGTMRRFVTSLRDWAPLLLIGIALAPAFMMRFWNIGAEGQVLMGAMGTALVMVYGAPVMSTPVLFICMFVSAVVLGALWGLIPAAFKAKFGTNETLFTLMMNYVAIKIVSSFYNKWRGTASALGKLNKATEAGWFPKMNILGVNASYGITVIVTVIMVFLMYAYLKYTKQGYEIAVVGESVNTARYAGINVGKVIVRTMLISGALCGFTGFLVVAGSDQTISATTAGGNGFTAIIVAWLAKFNTFYMVLISFLLTFLDKGATQIASSYANLNDYAADIIKGIILFFILGSEFFIHYNLVFRGKKKEG